MKYINRPVRIFDDDNLKCLGVYKPFRVAVLGKNEVVFNFREHWYLFLGILVVIAGLIWALVCSTKHNHKLVDEYNNMVKEKEIYQEIVEVASNDYHIELLAGHYALSKTPIPTNRDEIFKVVCESGAWYPEIIMAQIIQESGAGTSNVYRNANNLFGMKKVRSGGRPTLQLPNTDYNGYGVYMNWQHSILDRVLWDTWVFKKKKPETREEYLNRLGCIYAEDPNYVSRVLTIAKQWEDKVEQYVPKDTTGILSTISH